MRSPSILFASAAFAISAIAICPVPLHAQSSRSKVLSPSALFKQVSPCIVAIKTDTGRGTGFFVFGNMVFTCHHVIEGAKWISVTDSRGVTYAIRSVATDPGTDIAVLRLKQESKAPFLWLAATNDIAPGDAVWVIGNPLGLSNSITAGVLSAKRQVGDTKLLQITAPISPGSSGSPIVDARGRAIGVVSYTYTKGQNVNMGVASNNFVAAIHRGFRTYEEFVSGLDGTEATATRSRVAKDAQSKTAYSEELTNKYKKPFVALEEAYNKFYCNYYNAVDKPDRSDQRKEALQAFTTYAKEVLAIQDACYEIENSVGVRSKLSKLRETIETAKEASYIFFVPIAEQDEIPVEEYKAASATYVKSFRALVDTRLLTLKSILDTKGVLDIDLWDALPPYLDANFLVALNKICPKPGSSDKVVIGYAPIDSGLVAGDEILKLRRPYQSEFTSVSGWNDLRDFLRKYPGLLYVMQVRRGDAEQEVTVKIKDE